MHTSATSQSPSTSQNAFPPFRPCVTVRILLSKHKARLKSSSVLSPLPEDDPAALLLLGFRLQAATRQLSQACPVGTMPPWPPRWWDSALQPRKYSHRGTQTAGLEAKHHLPAAQLVTYSSAHSPGMKPWSLAASAAGMQGSPVPSCSDITPLSSSKGLSLFSLHRALISVFCLKLGYRFLSPEEIHLPFARRTGKICCGSKRTASIAQCS